MSPQTINVMEREKEAGAFKTARNIYEASTATGCQTLFQVLEVGITGWEAGDISHENHEQDNLRFQWQLFLR